MEFAHFTHIWAKADTTPHERYETLWRELKTCDDLDFDYGFCVEHHCCPEESWMSSPSLYAVGASARTKKMRIGPMGYIVPLYHPLRLAEEIAIIDQMMGGRMEVGLVPGINAEYFRPFGKDYSFRKSPTFEFVDYLDHAYGPAQPFSFTGENFQTDRAQISVQPFQKPNPPMWMMSRDPATLDFCAAHGVSTGYFISVPRKDVAPRYVKYLEDYKAAGHTKKPRLAYCTLVFVAETDEMALDKALHHAARAYEGFLPAALPGETFEERVLRYSEKFKERGEDNAAKIMANIFNANFLIENDLVFIGSPDTVARKLKKASAEGMFNVFLGEFNFAELSEDHVIDSIRLFGEKVIPQLREFEPF